MAPSADEGTRWLTAQEQLAWRRLAAILVTLPASMDAQLQRDAGLTLFDYMVLSALSEASSRTCSMSVIAARTNSSLSRLSHVITKMEGKGWVRRQPLPGNGRVTMATITDAGYRQLVAAAPAHVEHVRSIVFDKLDTEQVKEMSAIGWRLLSSLDPDRLFTATTEQFYSNDTALDTDKSQGR